MSDHAATIDAASVAHPSAPGEHHAAEPPVNPALPYDLAYRDEFWQSRDYENLCDRAAIRALLPPTGERLMEVGAGFGRLADEYAGYRSVVLLDPSVELLDAARERLGADPRFEFVPGDAMGLPFPDATFDAIVCVRVAHHFGDAGQVFREFARVLRPGGALVLEFANKRHLKSILRYATKRQDWSPFTPEPYEYHPFHFDQSPDEVRRQLREAGFRIGPIRAASLFRVDALKRRVPASVLAGIERPLQAPLGRLAVGPSVYLRARRTGR